MVFHYWKTVIVNLCRCHLLRQQDVPKWMPTEEKGRLHEKKSLVENRLNDEKHVIQQP
jgi:hypothetical protein